VQIKKEKRPGFASEAGFFWQNLPAKLVAGEADRTDSENCNHFLIAGYWQSDFGGNIMGSSLIGFGSVVSVGSRRLSAGEIECGDRQEMS